MFISNFIMGIIAAVLLAVGYFRGNSQHIQGLKITLNMIIEIAPLLLFAFIIAGMLQTFFSEQLLSRWIGRGSGMRGIFIGTIAGGFCPGGPYVSLPIAAGLLRSGAGIPTMVAFLTSWSLWAIARLPMEVGIMGWRFTLIRLVSTFFFPPFAGLVAQVVFKK